jgi:glycosyltransferase involved in cell wall biosynthesis
MNVLYLNTEDLTQDVSSGRVHFWAICRELQRMGANVTVVAPGYRFRKIVPAIDVPCWGITVPLKNFISLLLFEIALLFSVPWIVLRKRPEALLVRGGGPGFIPGLVFFAFRLFGVRVVLECNGITWEEFRERGFPVPVSWMVRFSAWQSALACHHIIGVTREIADAYCDLASRPRTDGTEIANGVDPAEFVFSPSYRKRIRAERSVPEDAFIVGYVGAFSVWHGIPLMVDAAEILHKKHNQVVRFVLVGTGECYREAEAKREAGNLENLLLTGQATSRQDLSAWMACFDVGLCINLPSQRSPLKYFEYLACGIPVIGSGVPQLARLIDGDKTGIFLAAATGEKIAEAIESMHSERSHWSTVGARNRLLSEQQHSWQSVARQVYDLLFPRAIPKTSTLPANQIQHEQQS